MQNSEADQIADLLNRRNQLTRQYTADLVLEHANNYLYEVVGSEVVACVEVKKVQWYQAELCHLTVAEAFEGKGYGRALIQRAIAAAEARGARLVQCTIREGNGDSERAFVAAGFAKVGAFYNERSGNNVGVYHRPIHAAR